MITAIRPYTPQVRQNQQTFQAKIDLERETALIKKRTSQFDGMTKMADLGAYSEPPADKEFNTKVMTRLRKEHPDNEFIKEFAQIFGVD